MEIQTIIKDIPEYNSFIKIEPICKGVSSNKYCVEKSDGIRLLLEINDVSEYERQKKVIDIMNLADNQGIPMCKPIAFDVCNDGKNIYQLTTWCEGKDLEHELPILSEANQYAVGLKSGEILRRLHSVSAPDGLDDWYDKYTNLCADRIYWSLNCGVEIEGHDLILAYYEKNKHLLKGRPQSLRHGDYHNENLLVTDNLELYVIDWNLMEYGHNYADPWEEFNRIMHADLIPHYTTGMIHSYFNGEEPPEEFWDLLSFYLSATSLMLVSWAFYFEGNKKYREGSLQNVRNVLDWFDNMKNPVPTWYFKDFQIK